MCSIPPDRIEPCPFLPEIGDARWNASALGVFRDDHRGAAFYELALRCAQSKWLDHLPAQALLMINRAMGATLNPESDADLLRQHPIPYRAVVWILRHGDGAGFIGNPRRHFQHLATRMAGHNLTQRIARAWACWALAKTVNPDWPADLVQLEREHLQEPGLPEIAHTLARHGLPGEVEAWNLALHDALGEHVHDRHALVRDLEGSG